MTTTQLLEALRAALAKWHAEQQAHPTPETPADDVVAIVEVLDARLSRGDLLPDAWSKCK